MSMRNTFALVIAAVVLCLAGCKKSEVPSLPTVGDVVVIKSPSGAPVLAKSSRDDLSSFSMPSASSAMFSAQEQVKVLRSEGGDIEVEAMNTALGTRRGWIRMSDVVKP